MPARPWKQHTATAQSQLHRRSLLWARLLQGQGPCNPPYVPMAFPSSLVEPVNILRNKYRSWSFSCAATRVSYKLVLQQKVSTSGGTSQSSMPWTLHLLYSCSLAAVHAFFLSLSILFPAPSHSLLCSCPAAGTGTGPQVYPAKLCWNAHLGDSMLNFKGTINRQ